MEEIISFKITPYSLANILLALNISGINDFAITKEDDDLVIRIKRKTLENAVYKTTKSLDCDLKKGCK